MNKKPLQRTPLPGAFSAVLLMVVIVFGFLLHTSTSHAASYSTKARPMLSTGVNGVSVFVEPAAGEQPILNAINNAQTSIYVEMYLLTDTNVINALESAAENGLDVRVMLDPDPYGVGSPASTLKALKAAGAMAEDSNPVFTYTHEKGMIIDGTTVYIMTSNFTKAALGGSSSSTTNREYDIIDSNAAEVKEALDIFNADWKRSSYTTSPDANIVLSPINSQSDFVALINSAQTSLQIEAEEMDDSNIEQAIVNAESRGVTVQVILPNGSTDTTGINKLDDGGVSVNEDTQYYMHAKIIVADGKEAFVGSENISATSLGKNRELGILISDKSVISTLQKTFKSDLSHSTAA
jgi:cardiolipin synthase A/B